MVAVIVRHRVRDFDAWKPHFDEHDAVRRSHGAAGHRLYRASDDGHEVTVITEFKDAAGAQAFITDPGLREVMQRAGVEGVPEVHVVERVEDVDYAVAVG